ncbi:MAG: hypothetical protein JXA16_01800 [Bacteroidales bacterium]|nr:hypothetical protein [Bacteroidales bacterium]
MSINLFSFAYMADNKEITEPTAAQNNFYFKLIIFNKEKSKDCNSKKTYILIENDIVLVENNYGGFKARTNSSAKYNISNENKEKLINYLTENKLNTSLKLKNEKVNIGIHTDINCQLQIKGKVSNIEVFGMVNDWSDRKENKKKTEIVLYHEKFNSLLVFMKLNLGFSLIEL